MESKELIVGILGGSVALAGLLLVFCGFLFAQAASFPPEISDDITDKFKGAGRFGIIPFVLSLILAGMSAMWLLFPVAWLFSSCWIGFMMLLIGTGFYGAIVICKYL